MKMITILLHLTALLARTAGIEDSPVDILKDMNSVYPGECSYNFILPEPAKDTTEEHDDEGNSLKKEHACGRQRHLNQRIKHLELTLDSYTRRLQRIEVYIKDSLTDNTMHLWNNAVHSDMTAMLDLGTRLLSQSTQYMRTLTEMETQVFNLEIQSLESSLSSGKLENKLHRQTNEIHQLQDTTDTLQQRMRDMEMHQSAELSLVKSEQTELQRLLVSQSSSIQNLKLDLELIIANNSALYQEQMQLRSTINDLLQICSKNKVRSNVFKEMDEQRKYKDCAELFRAGFTESGIYTIYINMHDTHKVYCNMESAGGGWTVIQLRKDGTLDFHRTWKEYKMGFGSLSGEHWLGNEFVNKLTSQKQYALRVELVDWEGKMAFSQYDKFNLGSEKQNYRLFLKSYSGTAGRQSSLVINGADFSTKDVDNDNCMCKCAVLLTGGWWFDACGPSNLNGMYYTTGQNSGKLNGIKWHYFRGPSYSLRGTTMMIRPLDF
nr:angiopoietin-1-like [Misgurnus anguillicaudatus]